MRDVEPIGVFYMAQNWYLLAWCRVRSDYRTFHLGRINHIAITDSEFQCEHRSFQTILTSMYSKDVIYKVVLRLDKSALRDIGSGKYLYGLQSEKKVGDHII